VVDPAAPSVDTCHFPSVAEAIAEAQRFGVAEVWLGGATGQVYGVATADGATLVIPAGMALAGDDTPPAPATRFLEAKGAGAEAVRLEAGATLAGVTVRRGTGGPALGVRVLGASPTGTASLRAVKVDGSGAGGGFETGVRVEGVGTVAFDAVEVRGATAGGAAATGRGLEVVRDQPDQLVSVASGVFAQNDTGIRVIRGDLTLTAPTVTENIKEGIDASPASGTSAERGLRVEDGLLAHNGSGLRVAFMQRFSLQRTRICGNNGMSRTVYANTRLVGGLYGVGNGTTEFSIQGNLLHGNGGDQVLVYLSTVPWVLSGAGATCAAAERNVFAGYTSPGVGVAAVGADVVARYAAWKVPLPASPGDFLFSDGGTLDAGTTEDPLAVCPKPSDALLVCP
jgi:hypothetical protein